MDGLKKVAAKEPAALRNKDMLGLLPRDLERRIIPIAKQTGLLATQRQQTPGQPQLGPTIVRR